MLKKLTLQFSKPIAIGARELCKVLPKVYHDVVSAEIDVEPQKDGIKTLVLMCNRCSPDEVLTFIRSLDKQKIQTLKGIFEMEQTQQNLQSTDDQATEQTTVDVNKACNDLGEAFKSLFGNTGNLSLTVATMKQMVETQQKQIAALQLVINGKPADPKTNTPAVIGLANMVDGIRQQSEKTVNDKVTELSTKVDNKIAELEKKEQRLVNVEKSCKNIEKHLAEMPLFKGVLSNGNTGNNAGSAGN